MSDMTNNINIINEITYYKCEISRETGTDTLVYTFSQPSDDTPVRDDKFYRMYAKLRDTIITNKMKYRHTNVVTNEIKNAIRTKINEYLNDERYNCLCIIFPYDGLTTYNEYYCTQITKLVKSYIDGQADN